MVSVTGTSNISILSRFHCSSGISTTRSYITELPHENTQAANAIAVIILSVCFIVVSIVTASV